MSKLKPTLTEYVINGDHLEKQFARAHVDIALSQWPEVGDLLIMPKVSGRSSAYLELRTVVEITEKGSIFVQGPTTGRARLQCPERCLIIGRLK